MSVLTPKAPSQGNNKESRLRKILAVGERLFKLKGYERTTFYDIIRAAGFSSATVYKLFGDKEKVYNEIAHKLAAEFAENVANMKIVGRLFQNKVRSFVKGIYTLLPTKDDKNFFFDATSIAECRYDLQRLLKLIAEPTAEALEKIAEETGVKYSLPKEQLSILFLRALRGTCLEKVSSEHFTEEKNKEAQELLARLIIAFSDQEASEGKKA